MDNKDKQDKPAHIDRKSDDYQKLLAPILTGVFSHAGDAPVVAVEHALLAADAAFVALKKKIDEDEKKDAEADAEAAKTDKPDDVADKDKPSKDDKPKSLK